MALTVYRSSDPGAPSLTGTAGSAIALLDAILVNGYGTKAAAGWTKEFSGTNLAAYRMAATGGGNGHYLRLDDTAPTMGRWIGYESMTGVSTGSGPFPTESQQSDGFYLRKSSSADSTVRPWVAFANNRIIYLFTSAYSVGFGNTGGPAYEGAMLFGQGDSLVQGDAYATFAIGDVYQSSTYGDIAGATPNSGGALGGHFVARPYGQVGGSLQVSKSAQNRGAPTDVLGGGTHLPTSADPITGTVYLSQVYIMEDVGSYQPVPRAAMPKLFAPQHNLLGNHTDVFAGAGALVGRSFMLVKVYCRNGEGRLAVEVT